MAFCPDCGQEFPEGAGNCAGCGRDLTGVDNNVSTGPSEGASPEGVGITDPTTDGREPETVFSTSLEPTGGGRKPIFWILVGVFAGVAVLTMVGVLFYYIGNFSEPRSLKLVSADTEMVMCVKPSYLQQQNINKLINTYLAIPAVKKAYDEKLKEMKEKEGTDYEMEIRPWLGEEFTLALPRLDEPERAVLIIAYKSKTKAQEYLDKESQKPGSTQENYQGVTIVEVVDEKALAMSGSYCIIGTDKELVKRVIDRQQGVVKDNITQSPGFQKVMDNLTGGRSVFFYIKVSERLKNEMRKTNGEFSFADQVDYQDAGVSLSFESDGILTNYLVTTGKAPAFYKKRATVKEEMKATLELLPDDCAGFFHYSNTGQTIQEALKTTQGDLGREMEPIESEMGISIQRDLLDILRGDFTMAIMPQHGLFFGERVPLSLAVVMGIKDQKQAVGSVDKITGYLKKNQSRVNQKSVNDFQVYDIQGQYGSAEFSIAMDNQHLVLGSSPQLTDLMANKHNPLGKSENYQKAFTPFSSEMEPVFYVNVPKSVSMYQDSLSIRARRDFEENIQPWFNPIKSLSMVDSGWDEKNGMIKGGLFLRIEGGR